MVAIAPRQRTLSRESCRRLVDDCVLLVDYVTRQPDSRLDWCFEARGRVAGEPPARLAPPPEETKSKEQFLRRLVAITCELDAAQEDAQPGVDQIAFLIAARDFLSSLARPATVETLRITGAYVRPKRLVMDFLAGIGRAWDWMLAKPRAADPDLPSTRFGRRMSLQVLGWQAVTLALVLVTVTVSIYALVGRGLLEEVAAVNQQFAAMSKDMETAEQNELPLFRLFEGMGEDRPEARPQHATVRYCEHVRREQDKVYFATRQQQRLCDRNAGYDSTLVLLFQDLETWRGRLPLAGPAREAPNGPANVGLLRPAVADALPPVVTPDARQSQDALSRVQLLRVEKEKSRVILQAITEYGLPCLYAMLGAMAAGLRYVARRVEESTLDYGDGGVLSRTLVLGLLFGAVIGLFASQMAPAEGTVPGGSATASLTPAALSLLAGYSVVQVFQFFDGLALRVFGPKQAGPAAG